MRVKTMRRMKVSLFLALGLMAGVALKSYGALTFGYYQNEDGDNTISIAAVWCSGTMPNPLVIPSEYEGFVVTRLVNDEGWPSLEESDFTKAKNVVLPNTLLSFGGNPFVGCLSLETVEVESGGMYKTRDNMLLSVDETELVAVYGKRSFSRTALTIPETVERMGSFALFNSEKLKSVTIPKNVREIQGNPFVWCCALESVTIDPENQWFKMVNNCLVSMDGKLLIGLNGPNVTHGSSKNPRHVVVPDGVEGVGELSLTADMVNLRTIWLPPTVTDVYDALEWGTEDAVYFTATNRFVVHGEIFCDTNIKDAYFYGPVPDGFLDWNARWWDCGKVKTIHYTAEFADEWRDALKQIGQKGALFDPADFLSPYDSRHDSELAASYGPFVPGERVSLALPALAGYAANGLPKGLKLDRKTGTISGSPTRPTGDAGAAVTFTKKGALTRTARFVVGPVPMVAVALAGDAARCSVSGAGKAYLAGKRVTLAAKAPKGTAFVGWTRDGEPWPNAAESKSVKLSFSMPSEDLALVASFEKEKMSVACPGLADGTFTVGVAGDGDGIPLEVATQSGVKSVKASKLPSGMKLVKDKATGAWSIVGSPKKPGTYNVVLTVTAKSGATETVLAPVEVAPLPAWAAGAFGGVIGRFAGGEEDDDFRPYGTVSLKVAATGRLTAKIQAGGKTYSFSADGFAGCDAARETFRFEMATRAGDVYVGEIAKGCHDVATLMRGESADAEGAFAPAGREPYAALVWRNEHGRDGRLGTDATGRARKAMDAVKALKRVELAQFDPAWGTVEVTIDARGNAKFSGKTADGVKVNASSFLMLDGSGCHVISDLTFYDRKTRRVYAGAVCWQPLFDAAGDVVGWDDACCDKSLKSYPFE